MICIRRARLLFVLFSFFIFGCIIIENANSLFNPIYLAAKYNIRQSGSFSKSDEMYLSFSKTLVYTANSGKATKLF